MDKKLKYRYTAIVLLYFVFVQYIFGGEPDWETIEYADTTAFYGEIVVNEYDDLYQDTIPLVEAGDYIGVFVGDECRMVEQIFQYNGVFYVNGSIQGGDVDDTQDNVVPEDSIIQFKLWDHSDDSVYVLLGTTSFNSEYEIGTYLDPFPVGMPNSDNSLSLLSINDHELTPEFNADSLEYTVYYYTGDLPDTSDYTVELTDIRASVEIDYATAEDSVTIIIVTAEDGITRTYTLVFVEQECDVGFVFAESVVMCENEQIPALTAETADNIEIRWYASVTTEEVLATGSTFTPEYAPIEVYVAGFDNCEGQRVAVTITVDELPETPEIFLASTIAIDADPVEIQVSPEGGELSGDGVVDGYFDPSTVSVGVYSVTYTVTNGECELSASTTISVEKSSSLDYSSFLIVLYEVEQYLGATETGTAVGQYSEDAYAELSKYYSYVLAVKDTAETQATLDSVEKVLQNCLDAYIITQISDEIQTVNIIQTERYILVDNEFQLEYELEPEGVSDDSLVWYVSDSDIASVSASGVVTAQKVGSVYVYLQYEDIKDSALIVVYVDDVPLYTDDLEALIDEADSLLTSSSVGDSVGQYLQEAYDKLSEIKQSVENAANDVSTQDEIDSLGLVLSEAIEAFEDNIIADEVTAFELDSTSVTLKQGDSYIPQITFYPYGVTEPELKWLNVENDSVVDLNATTGEVEALAAGTATIAVRLSVGETVYSKIMTYTVITDSLPVLEYDEINLVGQNIVISFSEAIVVNQDAINDFTVIQNSEELSITYFRIEGDDSTMLVLVLDDLDYFDVLYVSYENNGNIVLGNEYEMAAFEDVQLGSMIASSLPTEDREGVTLSRVYNTFNVEASSEINELSVYTIEGKLLEKYTVNENVFSFDLDDIHNTVYIISIKTESLVFCKKVILY